MKKFRKLIPALAMLLVSATVLASSTFAWFSMNTKVTAKGMEVTAQSNTVFLQIKTDAGEYGSEATASLNKALYPVSHDGTILSKENVDTPASWWYGYSASPADATLVPETKTPCTDLTEYVAKQTFTLAITEDSGLTNAKDLVVSKVTITEKTSMDGVRVVVVGPNGLVEFDATNADGNDTVKIATSVGKDSESASVEVTVYIYIDGENTTVKTANKANLGGKVELEFSVTAASAS